MEEKHNSLDLGMLCRCCNCESYKLPELEGFSAGQVEKIEDLCKLCIEYSRQYAVSA